MRKILVLGLVLVLFSCSSSEEKEKEPDTYNVQLTATCPSAARNTYCVTKEVYDSVITAISSSSQGCIYIQINTISDGVKKGYILSAGVGGCN